MVVFDSTYLIDLFNPKLQGDQRLALDQLIAELSRAKTRVLIPAPCITELLVYAGAAATDYNNRLNRSPAFEVVPFDRRAATDCASLLADAWAKKQHRKVTHTKFKYDWMVTACATSRGVKTVYSDDADIAACAKAVGIRVVRQADLLDPPNAAQPRLI